MKLLGIMFLIFAVMFLVMYLAYRKLEANYKSKFLKYSEEIRILKQRLEEAENNETIAIRIKNLNNDAIKAEYEKRLKEILEDIDIETRCYGNPVIALTKIKSIIKELSSTAQSVR